MRQTKAFMVLVLCAGCLHAGCGKKSTPLRPLSELTVQERRSIFLVTDGALFASVGKSLNGADFTKAAESVFGQVDEHYSLQAGSAALIWRDGKERHWQLGMDGQSAVLSLTEKGAWTISDVEKLLKETTRSLPNTAQDESETINRLIEGTASQ
jgi:hypothetical protein